MEKDAILKVLDEIGIDYNEKAQNIIDLCDDWYCNRTEHKKTTINNIEVSIPSINFAKRCCSDDANLCEVVEVNSADNEEAFKNINAILKRNRFAKMFRKQLERLSASGTVGAYVYLKNAQGVVENGQTIIKSGDLAINYAYAENIVPITVENDEVTECAFMGSNIKRGKREDVLVVFKMGEEGRYYADSYYFTDGKENVEKRAHIELGETKPFAIMVIAEVNNIEDMEGYGLPKLYSSIPVFKALDLAYYILYGDLDKGEKLVFINELLTCIQKDINGNPYLTKEQKELFVLLGEKLPTQDDVIKEYNPIIRIDEITKVFETLLSILSLTFGFGTKKYTFENGQIKTASEYIGERQDCMQEVNKQRGEAVTYITDLVNAIKWFSNAFDGGNYNLEDEILVDFDDSYIEDKASKVERERDDALSFGIPKLTIWYLMDAYNLTEEEATALVVADAEQKQLDDTIDANLNEND